MEPRNITGLVTQGGPTGWVTIYNLKYSHDNINWNSVLDQTSNVKNFLGNFDENTPIVNSFDLPILATYIKVLPIKWEKNIQMRIEPHGCFHPYRK